MKNKPRCKHCRCIISDSEDYQQIPLGKVHSDCMEEYVKTSYKKAKDKIKKRKAKGKIEMRKAKIESAIKKARKTAKTNTNRYIRKRDEKKGCITCNCFVVFGDRAYHAGHYKPVGARSDLEHNEDNIFGQCEQCNTWQASTAQRNFKQAVINRIGEKREKELEKRVYIKKDLEYYKSISKKFNRKFKELNKYYGRIL